ncbi:MAG: AgmX/PglI C-terminal domain-containing protein [Deltaproteobacteria bacterium]|nr:AgmX/PglI C-terminal domain-containing protein [Deltaproteobacteria bacterium]
MNQNQGRGQQAGGGAAKPGQMTMAMRAMPQATGPKVLRIGKVQGGRVIEERVVKQRTHVTIGSSHTNMFLASGNGVPETMKLFELVGNEYVVNLADAMTGRVALPTGVTDVAQARASGVAKRVGNYYQLKLTDDSRGKVVIGDTTFLFQFVAPPPVQPKPQLPLAVQGGIASQIDWAFTIIAAFSFLVHFGFAGAVNSDWLDPLVDEEGEVKGLIADAANRPTPPIEEKKDQPDKDAKDKDKDKDKDKKDDKKVAEAPKGDTGKKAGPAGPAGPSQMTAKQGAALSNELDQLEMKALGSLGGSGPAQSSIMKPGASAADSSLDAIAAKGGGVDTSGTGLKTGAGGGGPMMPGQGGGKGLSGVGDAKGGGGGGGGGGGDKSTEVKVPVGEAATGAAAGASNVKDADSVIARNKWRFKACYQKALATDPNAGGTVKITVKVGEGGEVTSASIASNDTSSTLAACIQSSFMSMKFAEPDGGSATFTVPVVLSAKK